MRGYNKVILAGNLTRDVEVREFDSGSKMANITLAVSRYWKRKGEIRGEEEVNFINCVLWQPLADIAERYLKKGSAVLVDGRLQVRSYTDKNGDKKWITEVVVENLNMLGDGKADNSINVYNGNNDNYNNGNDRVEQAEYPTAEDEYMNMGF